MANKNKEILVIGDHVINRGEDTIINMPVPGFSAYLPAQMQIRVIRNHKPGPRVMITAAMHGDEIIGVEIIHRLLQKQTFNNLLCGDIILIPIINVAGFIVGSRYMPDRRDLNRSFPGGESGSLAARMANFLTTQILDQCTHGIDLHAGGENNFNLPQIRVDISKRKALEMAKAFAPPLILNSRLRDGSMRKMADEKNIPMLVFEGSEAGRFDQLTSLAGSEGITNVLKYLKMIPGKPSKPRKKTIIAKESKWVRSPESGIFYAAKHRGDKVRVGQLLGYVSDPLGQRRTEVRSEFNALIVGQSLKPVVHEGEALFNMAFL